MAFMVSLILLLLAMAMVTTDNTELPSIGLDSWDLTGHSTSEPTCDGLVVECMDQQEEMPLDSEINLRMLYPKLGFISYGALRRDHVPCNRRGHSYYNCQNSRRANPYRRGCSIITRCARILE